MPFATGSSGRSIRLPHDLRRKIRGVLMRIVYFGNGLRGVRCLNALMEDRREVCAVVGHGESTDVLTAARENGLKTYWPEKVNDPAFLEELRKYGPDLFVLSGYNKILKKALIHIPTHGVINLHGGKLPEYRGVAPINWQIINGERIGGCCLLYVDEGIDTGDIIEQQSYRIEANDTAEDIIRKQLDLFPAMLIRAVKAVEEDSVGAVAQDADAGAYYTRRYPKDGRIDWRLMKAGQVHNLVRALRGPYPPAFCLYGGEKVAILKTRNVPQKIAGVAGRIALKRDGGVVVIAEDRGLLVQEIAFPYDGAGVSPAEIFTTGDDLG
jgi:methionyl-tRNA formyltransferase